MPRKQIKVSYDTPAEAARAVAMERVRREAIRRQKEENKGAEKHPAYDNFMEFAKLATDGFWDEKYPHMKLMGEKLMKVASGEITRLMIFMPPRHTKPVHIEADILMGDGTRKRLGDIEVGDYVIGISGTPCLVTAVHEQGVLPLLKILGTSHREVMTAADHPFLTTNGWIQAGHLTKYHHLVCIGDFTNKWEFTEDRIESIRPAGQGECRCLTVDTDHSFIANDFVVSNSLTVSHLFSTWLLGRYPNRRVILTSYQAEYAAQWGGKVRAELNRFQNLFGVRPARSPAASDHWDIQGYRGGMDTAGAGGAITGKGAHCFSPKTKILTEFGDISIKRLCMLQYRPRVWSFDHNTQQMVLKSIEATRVIKTNELYEVTTTGGRRFKATGNHPIYISGFGYKETSLLCPGDKLYSIEKDMPFMHGADVRERENVYGMLPQNESSRSRFGMQLLSKRIQKASLSARKSFETKLCGFLLFCGLFKCAPRRKTRQALCKLSNPNAWKTPLSLLFQRMLPIKSANDRGAMSLVWFANEQDNRRQSKVLLWGVRGPSPFISHDGEKQSSLQNREKLFQMVFENAATDNGTGKFQMCGMSKTGSQNTSNVEWVTSLSDKSSGPSYRRETGKQLTEQLNNPMQTLPHKTSQISTDTVAVVRKLRTRDVSVYDLQVADTSNFFAEGILSHNCLIIDDPIKNSQEAKSDITKATIIDWYQSTAYTRLESDPRGAMIIVLCMTGDTPVLMADDTERELRNVKVGDKVATYDNGKLSVSTVLNHKSNGLDSVYKIKMASGKIVHANERHPFLASEDGQFSWVQLKDLTTDHRIVTLTNSVFTTTGIESITPAGTQEVFDLQVERTENFIANGLVSHNTRWQEDDLAGVLLQQMKDDPNAEQWEVISLPAFAEKDDPLGREEGEALWPEKYPVEILNKIRATLKEYWFSAMYQQSPTSEVGGQFKAEWMEQTYDEDPREMRKKMFRVVQTVDSSFKDGVNNDFSVIATWGWQGTGYYLLNIWREKVEFPELKDAIKSEYWDWKPDIVLVEPTNNAVAAKQEITRDTSIPIEEVTIRGSKENRADVVSPLFKTKKVWLPIAANAPWIADWIQEHIRFPTGKRDDQVDTTGYALTYLKTNDDELPAAGVFTILRVNSMGGRSSRPRR